MGIKKVKILVNVLVSLIFIGFTLTFYSTFSMNTEYKFESTVYAIEDNYIKNVSSNTNIELFLKYFDMENCSIRVFDNSNEEILKGVIPNGSKTVVYGDNGKVLSSYINIVTGDYNLDGNIDDNDYYEMGKCLVSNCSLDSYLLKSVDIDLDGEFHINDLVLLDNAITEGYTGIFLNKESVVLQTGEQDRLVAFVTPNYGVNQNVKWSSTDNNIVTVDNSGKVTGRNEGNAKIIATTFDGKYSVEANIIVDNTIQLSSYDGIGYVGGNNITVGIKAIDYEDITCSSSNEEVSGCEVSDEKLIIVSRAQGTSTITVTSSKYGVVTYNLVVHSVYFNIMPKYVCGRPGGSVAITVSGFNSGELTFVPDDNEIISNASMDMIQNKRMLRINFGTKVGRTTLKVTEGNGNSTNLVIADVTSMHFSEIGKFTKIGEEVTFTAIGDNLGVLTCRANDLNKGTCRVEGNKVIITPLAVGSVNVDVYNNFSYEDYNEVCGQKQLIVVIQE